MSTTVYRPHCKYVVHAKYKRVCKKKKAKKTRSALRCAGSTHIEGGNLYYVCHMYVYDVVTCERQKAFYRDKRRVRDGRARNAARMKDRQGP